MSLRIVLLIATAILLVGMGNLLLPRAEAQGVGTSTLSGTVCTVDSPVMYGAYPAGGGSSCGGGILPNATLHLTRSGPLANSVGGVDATVKSDAKGNYLFDKLPDATDYKLEVSRSHFVTVSETGVKVSGATTHDVAMQGDSLKQSGKVVAPGGRPVAGAQVSICCGADGSGSYQPPTPTAADGTFTIATTAGYRNVNVNDASGFEDFNANLLVDGTPLTLTLRPLPPPDAYIVGIVRDQDGNPLAGIRIDANNYGSCCPQPMETTSSGGGSSGSGVAEPSRMPPYYQGGSNHTTTGADGRYRLGVYSGTVNLNVNQEGYASKYESVEVAKGETVTHDLKLLKFPPRTAHIEGRVTDAATGKGLRAVAINVRAPEFGRYECSSNGLEPTPVYYADSKPAMAADSSMPIRDPGPYQGCAITVNADGTFSGNVTPGYSIVEVYFQQYLSCSTTTDADNSASKVCGPDYFAWAATLRLASGTTKVDVALVQRPGPDATVSGYVLDGESGKAIAGATISFSNQDNGAYGTATTDQDGSFKVRLRSGFHMLNAQVRRDDGRPSGYLTWQGVLDVKAGDNPFDVTLTRGEEAGGGGCCYMMEKGGAAPGVMTAGGAPASDGNAATGTSTAAPSVATAAEFQDLGGGLGPYNAAARSQTLQSGKSSPHLELPVVLSLLGLFAWSRRRT